MLEEFRIMSKLYGIITQCPVPPPKKTKKDSLPTPAKDPLKIKTQPAPPPLPSPAAHYPTRKLEPAPNTLTAAAAENGYYGEN